MMMSSVITSFTGSGPKTAFLSALVRKTETIKRELGSLAQVIDAKLTETLKRGIRRDAVDASGTGDRSRRPCPRTIGRPSKRNSKQPANGSRPFASKLTRSETLLDDSQKSIGFDEEHFRSAISSALELVGAEPLKAHFDPTEAGPPRCSFPSLDQREGADPTWADTMDTLTSSACPRSETVGMAASFADSPRGFRRPRHDDRRSRSPAPGTPHRPATARTIHRPGLRASRPVPCLPWPRPADAIPRVVLLGRLCLYGPGAARLHEELIPVTARWTDPKIRKATSARTPANRRPRRSACSTKPLIAGTGRKIDDQVLKQLQASAPQDIEELLPHLQTRGEEYAADARKKLVERGEAEAKAMREILETQKKYIAQTVAKHDKTGCSDRCSTSLDEELRQLESNRRYWDKRLAALETELRTEPDRIRELYDVKATRIEPVGLVYLWPVTG